MKLLYKLSIQIVEIILIPLTIVSSLWLKFLRYHSIGFWQKNSKISRFIFEQIGLFPIVNHYYEPLFNVKVLKNSLSKHRNLPGINFNINKQLSVLKEFRYNDELCSIAALPKSRFNFNFKKGPFLSGDAEILYNIIRHAKPKIVLEVGCGHSSLMIQHAISKNNEFANKYICNHISIEPYENKWLKSIDKIQVVEKKIEDLSLDFFDMLEKDDILFIDSSHMIRPQGDVLFEILEILPRLKSGVLVHFHDIFTPRDYLDEWLKDGLLFWNEQYLLEAFLSSNDTYEIYCAVNYLKNNHYSQLKSCCPLLEENRQPGSFWIRKV